MEENGTYPVTYQLIDSNGSSTVLSAENAYLLGDGRLDVNHDEKTPAFTAVATNTVVTYVLPNTGGSGTRHYILAGCLLCILTTMCYFLPYTKKQ